MSTRAKAKRGSDARRTEVAEDKQMLTTIQVALLLGVDKRTVYRLASAGKLRRVKVGRATRFRPDDLKRLIDRGII